MRLTVDVSARQIGSALIESLAIPTAVPAPDFTQGERVSLEVALVATDTGAAVPTAGAVVEVILADPDDPDTPLAWSTLAASGEIHTGQIDLATTELDGALGTHPSIRALLIVRATYYGGTQRVVCRMPVEVFAAPVDEGALSPTPRPQLVTLEQLQAGNLAGPPGAAGASIRAGSGAPANSLGKDGDLYVDSTSGDLFERVSGSYSVRGNLKGLPGRDGIDGQDGTDGVNGSAVRVGVGAPANTLGVDADSYINSSTGDVYERASGVYVLRGNLKGPKGDNGNAGADGLGVPAGGTTGQVLRKKSGADNDTEWADPATGASGETNTGANVGTGEAGVFQGKSGIELRFRRLKAGANVTISEGTDDITVSAAGGSGGSAAYGPVTLLSAAGATDYASWDAAYAAAAAGDAIHVWRGAHTMAATCAKAVAVYVRAGATLTGPAGAVMFSVGAATETISVFCEGTLRPCGSMLFNGANGTLIADVSRGRIDVGSVPSPYAISLYNSDSNMSDSPNCDLVFGRVDGASAGYRRLVMSSGPATRVMRVRFTSRIDFGNGRPDGVILLNCGTTGGGLTPVVVDLDAISAQSSDFISGQVELRGACRLALTGTDPIYASYGMISCGSAPGVTVRGSLEIAMASTSQDAVKNGVLRIFGVCTSNRPCNANVNVTVGAFVQDSDIAP